MRGGSASSVNARKRAAFAATAEILQADLPVLRDQVEQCQERSVKLSTAQADLSATSQRLELAGERLSAMSEEPTQA